jgi:hypothetical protein
MHRFSAVPIVAVVIIAFGQVSTAADIPAKALRPAITSLPVNNWTGLYDSKTKVDRGVQGNKANKTDSGGCKTGETIIGPARQ